MPNKLRVPVWQAIRDAILARLEEDAKQVQDYYRRVIMADDRRRLAEAQYFIDWHNSQISQ